MTALLSARNLIRTFAPTPGAPRVQALRDVDIEVHCGRTLGIIGESGSGKSTLARLLLMLDRPTSGEILFDGADTRRLTSAQRHDFRRRIQPVFQNPYASLDPRMTIAGIVSEPMLAQGVPAAERRKRTDEALARVGMSSADATRFPSEFSGGQRQRIAIARAIAAKPELIVLDEPVSSLDISVRAQVLNLLLDLKRDTGVGYLMISHDLRTLAAMCDDIAVMYLGRIVEAGPAQPLCSAPQHPYTRALFAASLTLDNARASPPVLAGEPPSPIAPPAGCAFHPRCPLAFDPCSSDVPELSPHSSCLAACHALAKTASTD